MNFPPRSYLIGAQKAATTSLAYLLDQHPKVLLSTPKEPHFFSVNWHEGEDWYRAKFSGASDDTILIDASTSYSMAPVSDKCPNSRLRPKWGRAVPERIHSVSKDAKFIYLLRSPADRVYSAYWHNVRYGREPLPFREAIDAHPFYLDTSEYCAQIELFLKYFKLEDFLLIDFQDFSRKPEHYAAECLEFIGAPDCAFELALEEEKNVSFQFNSTGRALQRLLGTEKNMRSVNSFIKTLIPGGIHERLKQVISQDVPGMTGEDRAYLEEYFSEGLDRLRSLTGFEFASTSR